jgi:hypothetical protein
MDHLYSIVSFRKNRFDTFCKKIVRKEKHKIRRHSSVFSFTNFNLRVKWREKVFCPPRWRMYDHLSFYLRSILWTAWRRWETWSWGPTCHLSWDLSNKQNTPTLGRSVCLEWKWDLERQTKLHHLRVRRTEDKMEQKGKTIKYVASWTIFITSIDFDLFIKTKVK